LERIAALRKKGIKRNFRESPKRRKLQFCERRDGKFDVERFQRESAALFVD
jgi:hypothetical protein